MKSCTAKWDIWVQKGSSHWQRRGCTGRRCFQISLTILKTNVVQRIIQRRVHQHMEAPLQSIISTSTMELVSIDYLHLDKSTGGYEYVLLLVDHFTRFVQAYATKNKSATTAAKNLYNDYVLRFGLPARIMHDQGKEFENKLFSELERYTGISKSRTTPYHPQTNGCVERMNSTLLSMLRTLHESEKSKWHLSLNKLIFAYNCTRHDSTGYSPHYLMFGREAVLPLDLVLNTDEEMQNRDYNQFATDWKAQMEVAYKTALEKSGKRKKLDKDRRGKGIMLTELKPGDPVLVQNKLERGGTEKLISTWANCL